MPDTIQQNCCIYFLCNTSIHPATCDVVKYTTLLSTNLYLVLIVFYLYRYNQTYEAQRVIQLKAVVTRKTQDRVLSLWAYTNALYNFVKI